MGGAEHERRSAAVLGRTSARTCGWPGSRARRGRRGSRRSCSASARGAGVGSAARPTSTRRAGTRRRRELGPADRDAPLPADGGRPRSARRADATPRWMRARSTRRGRRWLLRGAGALVLGRDEEAAGPSPRGSRRGPRAAAVGGGPRRRSPATDGAAYAEARDVPYWSFEERDAFLEDVPRRRHGARARCARRPSAALEPPRLSSALLPAGAVSPRRRRARARASSRPGSRSGTRRGRPRSRARGSRRSSCRPAR